MEAAIPRDGSNIYSAPSGTTAVSGTAVASAPYNALVSDLTTDLNAARPISAGGTGATSASGARTNLGVSATDATITAIAALDFTTAGSMLYSTAADTFSLLTSTVAGRALLTAADAAAQRTALGLGTAALKATGTSGNTVPLLDGGNTWSQTQVFTQGEVRNANDSAYYSFFNGAGSIRLGYAQLTSAGVGTLANEVSGGNWNFTTTGAGVVKANGYTIADTNNTLTLSNKTLSSPTLSGTVAGSPTVSGDWTFTGNPLISGTTPNLRWYESDADVDEKYWRVLASGGELLIGGTNDAVSVGFSAVQIQRTGTTVDAINLYATLVKVIGGIQAPVAISSETSGTLTSASSNKQVNASGDITINDGVHAAGDRIEIYAGASARSIIQDTGMTLRLDGSATTGTRSLAARGRAAIYFVSNSEAIVSGMGVT